MNSSETSILKVTCLGHFLSHFNMLVFPAVLIPLTGRLNLQMTEVLGLSFYMYLLFGITALPWGYVADKIGAKPLLYLFHIGAACSAVIAAWCLDDPWWFSLALAGIGLFSGIYHPAGLGWIASDFENTSRAMAYNGMFGNLGLAFAPLLGGVINYFWGVKILYLIVGLLNLSGVFLLAKSPDSGPAVQKPQAKKASGENSRTWKPFLTLLAAMTMGGIVYRGTSVTLPAYFEINSSELFAFFQRIGGDFTTSNVSATLLTSLIYLVGMGGQYLGGRIGETRDLRWSYLIFHLITVPAAVGMALSMNLLLFMFALLHSFFLLGMQPIENTLVARLTPPSMLSRAFGLKFIMTFGCGALSVKLIGLVKESFGMSSVYFGLAAVSVVLCCLVVLLMQLVKPLRS